MKKNFLSLLALGLSITMLGTSCGQSGTSAPVETSAETIPSASAESEQETDALEAVESVAEISYANVYYDFAKDIAKEKESVQLVPATPDIPLTVTDENGATGVSLAASIEEGNTTDYYLSALASGNKLTFSAEGTAVSSANSSLTGDLEVKDGTVTIVPAAIQASEPTDEIITITLEDGTSYQVHTLNELLPAMTITGEGVDSANAGIYDFAIDKFLLRVSTEGELIYYRNLNSVGELMAENFAKQIASDGSVYYTYFVELHKDYRQANGGYSSGMYVVMDENYVETDYVTQLPNDDENHTHGEGYLDQHEFIVINPNHYLTLSYTPELISNLPENVTGINGGSDAYVWAGVFQEIKNGEILKEINTTDYPMLYDSSVEKNDYENSTDQGVEVEINGNKVPAPADGWMDYVHPNSLDYTLNTNNEVDKLLVSMRDQSAVYQFDFASGAMEWILGGKASTLTGYDEYTNMRADDKGNEFKALSFGQHYARYINKESDGTIKDNAQISLFDNQTGMAPFITAVPTPTLTRTFKAEIDAIAGTATIFDVINGTDLNQKTDKYHISSHCGSVDYFNENSVVIGWGLHAVIDNIGAMAPEGTISDKGYDDLRQGSRPIFTEYDAANDKVTFELSVARNPKIQTHEALFSYRTYKTIK